MHPADASDTEDADPHHVVVVGPVHRSAHGRTDSPRTLGRRADPPVRTTVIGLGRMGRFHLAALGDVDEIDVVALAEPSSRVDGRRHRRSRRRRRTPSSAEALAHPGLEACLVATPDADPSRGGRGGAGRRAARAVREAAGPRRRRRRPPRRLARRAGPRAAGRVLAPLLAAVAAASEVIAAGAIGTPVLVRLAQWDAAAPPAAFCDPAVSGGLAIDCGVHEYDLAEWLTGPAGRRRHGVVAAGRRCRRAARSATSTTSSPSSGSTTGRWPRSTSRATPAIGDDVRTEVLGSSGAVFVELLPAGRRSHRRRRRRARDRRVRPPTTPWRRVWPSRRGRSPRPSREGVAVPDATGERRVRRHRRTPSSRRRAPAGAWRWRRDAPHRHPPGRRRDVPRRQRRVRRALPVGAVTSGSVMVPCPWFTEIAEVAAPDRRSRPRRAPDAHVGEGALPVAADHRPAALGRARRRDGSHVARRDERAPPRRPGGGGGGAAGTGRGGARRPASTSPTSTPTWARRWRPSCGTSTSGSAPTSALPVLLTGMLAGYGPSNHLAGVTEVEYGAFVDRARAARPARLRRGPRDAMGPSDVRAARTALPRPVLRPARRPDVLRPPSQRPGGAGGDRAGHGAHPHRRARPAPQPHLHHLARHPGPPPDRHARPAGRDGN